MVKIKPYHLFFYTNFCFFVMRAVEGYDFIKKSVLFHFNDTFFFSKIYVLYYMSLHTFFKKVIT